MAAHLTKIYTRTGDNGTTGLSNFDRVPKDDPRLVAYADCEETNCMIGQVLALSSPNNDVAEVLRTRPGRQHVVLTGRDAHPKLIDVADLVTEMTKIKHPMDVGRKGQKGIEW